MLLMEDNFRSELKQKTYISLGSFDGLHKGHLSLIKETLELAKKNKGKSMVFTFKNHPLTVINNSINPKLIMSNDIKIKIFNKLGLDIVNLAIFNNDFMKISPEGFIASLIRYYNTAGLIVGFNYKFGYNNLGNIELLKRLSTKYNFELRIVPPVKFEEDIISSSRIRSAIENGEIKKANAMLTRPYALEGLVINGKKLGREMGFPTVNLKYDNKFVIPKKGVYHTIVRYNNKYYNSITNIGLNPTVDGKKMHIETHILNFNEYIYDKKIRIYFLDFIREENKFKTINELKIQIQKDKDFATKTKIRKIF